jgi:hypothetical protein
MEVDLVVEISNDTSVIRDNSHAFTSLWLSEGALKIHQAMFFVKPVNDRIRIVRK